MKKLLAILLTLVLALGMVACTEAGDATVQDGFNGVWYNSAGRKLELKDDGTYLLADEVEGGKWDEKSESEAECTDVYGTFSATYAKDDEGESLVFGPYGTFRRATEEQIARYESALRKPLVKVFFGPETSLAVWHETKESYVETTAIINDQGLAIAVPNATPPLNYSAAASTVLFYEEVILQIINGSAWILDRETGIVLHSGSILSYNDEYIALRKSRSQGTRKGYDYAVVDGKGNLVVDWTPQPTETVNGYEVERIDHNAKRAGGILAVSRQNETFYFFNPLTGKTFRVTVPNLSSYLQAEDKIYFREGSVAADWSSSPAQPVEYSGFTLNEDGTPVATVVPQSFGCYRCGDFFLEHPPRSDPEKGLTFRHCTTGETFTLNYPILEFDGKTDLLGDFGYAVYYEKEGNQTGAYLIGFDTTGKTLFGPIPLENWFSLDYKYGYLSKKGYLAISVDYEELAIFNKKGEKLFTGETLPDWFYDSNHLDSERGVIDADGRVLIPHVTFLPEETK